MYLLLYMHSNNRTVVIVVFLADYTLKTETPPSEDTQNNTPIELDRSTERLTREQCGFVSLVSH